MRNSNTQRSIVQDAKEEALVLSLDPHAGKKKKPKQLKPIIKPAKGTQKITGNFAAEVLADLERNDQNKERTNAMRQLDKEINGYLKFDSNILA